MLYDNAACWTSNVPLSWTSRVLRSNAPFDAYDDATQLAVLTSLTS